MAYFDNSICSHASLLLLHDTSYTNCNNNMTIMFKTVADCVYLSLSQFICFIYFVVCLCVDVLRSFASNFSR